MASTVIDEFIVSLGLDSKHFTEGQKKAVGDMKKMRDASDETAKSMAYRGKQAAEFYSNVKNAALGLFSVLAGGKMAEFAKDITTSVAATGRMAKNLGLSTEELSAFGDMAEASGGQATEAMQAFANMSSAIEKSKFSGQLAMAPYLTAIYAVAGVDNESSIYRKFNAWAQGKDPSLVTEYGSQLGYGPGMIEAARKPVSEFNKNYDEAVKRNKVTKENAEAAEKLEAAMSHLGKTFKSVGMHMVEDLHLTELLEGLSNLITKFHGLAEAIGLVGVGVEVLSGFAGFKFLLKLVGIGNTVATAVEGGAAAAGGGALARLAAFSPLLGRLLGAAGLMLYSGDAGDAAREQDDIDRMHGTGRYAPGSSAGKYGTPNRLLDNLEGIESNHNDPNQQLNKQSGATGAFQFLPSTVAMLAKKYGYKFDPKNRAEARDAADYYLQQLKKEHGGDMSAALAAYGGFKTKDSSWYTNRALAGVNAGGSASGGKTVSSQTNINTVNVIAATNDPRGFAAAFTDKIRENDRLYAMAQEANSGMR